MSKEIGVVKNVTQGSVKAVSLTGESRELKVGDIVYQGEKIVTESTDAKAIGAHLKWQYLAFKMIVEKKIGLCILSF